MKSKYTLNSRPVDITEFTYLDYNISVLDAYYMDSGKSLSEDELIALSDKYAHDNDLIFKYAEGSRSQLSID